MSIFKKIAENKANASVNGQSQMAAQQIGASGNKDITPKGAETETLLENIQPHKTLRDRADQVSQLPTGVQTQPNKRSLVSPVSKPVQLTGSAVAVNPNGGQPAKRNLGGARQLGNGGSNSSGNVGPGNGNTEVAKSSEKPATQPVSISQIGKLKVEQDTFDRGSLKYTKGEVEQLKASLALLETGFTNKELVGNHLKIIMASILDNPNLREILEPKDLGSMVRALRTSYQIHVAKADNRAGSRQQTAQFKNDLQDFLGSELAGLDLS